MEIVTLKLDEKITKPGFYRMPLAQHHNQPCDGVSVTSSVLRTLEVGTPADVWAFSLLNPDRSEAPERKALKMGTAMHSWVEGGEDAVRRDFIILPEDAPSRPSDRLRRAASPSAETLKRINFWTKVEARQAATGRPVITTADLEDIKARGRALDRDETAKAVIGGEPEITMAWIDDETGLWVLSRLDNMTFDGLLSDFKLVSARGNPFRPGLCHRRISDHCYYMQMALGAESMWRLTGEWPTDCALVFQMEAVPYHCHTVVIGDEELALGVSLNHRALRVFRECLDSGRWPGPGDVISTYTFTEGHRKALDARLKSREIPEPSDFVPALSTTGGDRQ